MTHDENTNWCQSVTGVVIRDGCVLLARHTYGDGKGRLIVPGGYVQQGEAPEDALRREFYEETRVRVQPTRIIGIRFNAHDWYIAFAADYVSGEAQTDQDENDLVVWMPLEAAAVCGDIPDLTRRLIACAARGARGLVPTPYESISTRGPGWLYAVPVTEDAP